MRFGFVGIPLTTDRDKVLLHKILFKTQYNTSHNGVCFDEEGNKNPALYAEDKFPNVQLESVAGVACVFNSILVAA